MTKIPLMYQAQVSGRGQIQYIAESQQAYQWVEEWQQGLSQPLPQFNASHIHTLEVEIPWRLISNSGLDDKLIRPVIGAKGYPFFPGSGMKGTFKRGCSEDEWLKYCGGDVVKNGTKTTKPGCLRFHGGYLKDKRAIDSRLVDIVHEQSDWQVKNQANHMNQLLQIDYRAYSDKKEFFKELRTTQLNILETLKFPVNAQDNNLDLWSKVNSLKNLKCTNSNNALLKWLTNLEPQFQSWALLNWIGEYEREFEDDLRNQLMHNLRGVEKKEVLAYLYGKPDEKKNMDESLSVREVYRTEIKQPFAKALCDFGLSGDSDDKNKLEEELQKLARSLNNYSIDLLSPQNENAIH